MLLLIMQKSVVRPYTDKQFVKYFKRCIGVIHTALGDMETEMLLAAYEVTYPEAIHETYSPLYLSLIDGIEKLNLKEF